ncbi:hypothetical protein F2Q70_00038358 [Brassica cretica]|uniref:Uncharacterized protein n=1 Tax=Brassica cretica TaxID=69181 RepID=A0A8S9K5B7_BRACR|nr:hypothetical protein F2Q70_00038358 [Brassica cretica]
MPSSTRSNKEKSLLFSDPALLKHTIRKEKRSASIDNNIRSSTDTSQQTSTDTTNPSTDSCALPTMDTSVRTSINIRPRDMVATLILEMDENGDMHDQEGHLCNASCQKLDDQKAVIPDQNNDIAVSTHAEDDAARPRMLADYNRPYKYLIDYGFDPFSSIVYSILEVFGASTRDDHRDRLSVDIGELEPIDTQDMVSIDSKARRKPV